MMKTRVVVLSVVLGCALVSEAEGFAKYSKKIPNGNGVEGVTAVGHTDPKSGGETNAFGKAFAKADYKWTEALCKADADGDGQTNGEELGDPCCKWTEGGTPAVASGATDPGSASSKLSEELLTKARALCGGGGGGEEKPGTVKPADSASPSPAASKSPTPSDAGGNSTTPSASSAAPNSGTPSSGTPSTQIPSSGTPSKGDGSYEYVWVEVDASSSGAGAATAGKVDSSKNSSSTSASPSATPKKSSASTVPAALTLVGTCVSVVAGGLLASDML